jgi:tetratricopeptide (TPR) repeat protein
MKKNISLTLKIQEILAGKHFAQLIQFENPDSWALLTEDDKQTLALSFILEGEVLLNKGDSQALQRFDLAMQLAPQNIQVLFRLAIAYGSQFKSLPCLKAVCKLLYQVTNLDPTFFGAWDVWANTLVQKGIAYNDSTFFHEAHQKFLEGQKVLPTENPQTVAEFYWRWGLCWHYQGKFSGEAIDFRSALDHYRHAADQGLQTPPFWNDFGNSLVEIGSLIGKKELYFEAIELYQRAVKLSENFFEGWFNLGCTFQKLFETEGAIEYFTFANESFENAAKIDTDNAFLWLKWGHLEAVMGKITRDLDLLAQADLKYEKADFFDSNNSFILSRWGEVQMLLGAHKENLQLLHEAIEKISKSLEMNPDNSESWYLYGCCLNEFGRYFTDENYYIKAIEKFQHGLSRNKNDPLLWYGLALAHFAIGELNDDIIMIEKAIRFCTKVIECGGQSFPQFWNDWGVALMKLSELNNDKASVESALAKFEQAIARQSDGDDWSHVDTEWLYNYGCALDFMGDFNEDTNYYEKAVQVLGKVVEAEPTYTHARYNLALALSHLGEATSDIECFNKASEHFQELLANDTEDEMGWNDWGLTLLNLAQLIHDPIHPEHSRKIYDQAESKFLHSIALGCVQSYYNLACLYSLIGNYPAALDYIERAENSNALPPLDDMLHDEWLDGLRNTTAFRNFLSHISNKDNHK